MNTPNRKFVDVNGVRTSYIEAGTGSPLVLFSGGGFSSLPRAAHSALDWDQNMDGLAEKFHVYAVDKLGHGFTGNPRSLDDYSRAGQIQHAYSFLTTMGLDGVTIAGHSQGGILVTRLTLQHPEIVRACIIVDSGSLAPGLTRDFGIAPEPALSRESQKWVLQKYSWGWDHISDQLLDGMVEIADQPRYREMVATISEHDIVRRVISPEMVSQGEETLRWIEEGRLKTPTLVVWGYNDPSAPLPRGMALFDLIASSSPPRAQMHVFNKAGHFSFREHPDAFNRVVREFASTV